MVLRPHGAQFAARVLDRAARAQSDGEILTIIPADRRYGKVTLDLGSEVQAWETRIRALEC